MHARRFALPMLVFFALGVLASLLFLVVTTLSDDTQTPAATQPIPRDLQQIPIEIEGDFGEGWEQTVPVMATGERVDVYDLSVRDGGLYVRRVDRHGDLDWHIQLAQIAGRGIPSVFISMAGAPPAFYVSLDDGRYFIRETANTLRCVRQRCDGDGATPRADFFGDEFTQVGVGTSRLIRRTMTEWHEGTWFYAATGLDEQRFDCVVRLNPVAWVKPEWGGDAEHTFHGRTQFWDDGEMLLAYRTLRIEYEREVARQRVLENMPRSRPPDIDASKWLNAEPPAWIDLRGKVVVLDFWTTSSARSVAELHAAQSLADRFEDQDFVVIGIRTGEGADASGDFVKQHKLTFPIAIDTGTTAQRYAIGDDDDLPSYFLIDKFGRIEEGYLTDLPDEQIIRELLSDDVRPVRRGE